MHVVIIGNGIAGNAVACNIRTHDPQCEITVVSAEQSAAYDPGALPYYVSGDVPRKEVFLNTIDYRQQNINLLLGFKVTEIDTVDKKVQAENGSHLSYDKLVIANGGRLIIPPIQGVNKKGVFSFKVLADADLVACHQGKTAVVIGSGLIGIEASEALIKKGYQVTMIELMDWIMPKVFDKEPAKILTEALVRNGVDVLTNEKVLRIEGDHQVESVVTDKREIKCDTVVLATGVLPASDLAVDAGIAVGKTRGIKVNDHMMTSAEDIYACGDCVESKDLFSGESALYLLRHNAIEQAKIIARNIAGENAVYSGAWGFTRAHYFDTHAVSIGKTYAGLNNPDDTEIIEKSTEDGYCRLIIQSSKLAGAQAIGKYANQMGILFGAIRRQDNLQELKSKWHRVQQLNSPYPWIYRIIGKYMNL